MLRRQRGNWPPSLHFPPRGRVITIEVALLQTSVIGANPRPGVSPNHVRRNNFEKRSRSAAAREAAARLGRLRIGPPERRDENQKISPTKVFLVLYFPNSILLCL